MTVRLIHKAGDTFTADCIAYLDLGETTPRDLTNVEIEAWINTPMEEPFQLTVTKSDPENGVFTLGAAYADTAEWRATVWYGSITYTENGERSSTETWQLQVTSEYNTVTE